jgi:predicted DNA-binding transcriptional regulator AlpA
VLNGSSIDLATFLAQPALAAKLSRMERAELLAQIKALEGVVLASLLADVADHVETEVDRLLDVNEAAARLSVTVDFLYRRKKLPFRVTLGPGLVRFSSSGIDRYIRQRAGSGKA